MAEHPERVTGWWLFAGVLLTVAGVADIIAAAFNAISYLMTIPSAPFWSLCMFVLSIVILYELTKATPRRF